MLRLTFTITLYVLMLNYYISIWQSFCSDFLFLSTYLGNLKCKCIIMTLKKHILFFTITNIWGVRSACNGLLSLGITGVYQKKSATLWNIILMKFWTLDEFLILALEFQDYLVTSSLPQKLYQLYRNSGSYPFSILDI